MTYVDRADFKNLFIEELGWDQPTAKPLTVEMDDSSFNVIPIAGFHGLHVWACGSLPDRSTQAQIDREVSATSTERLIIFHDGSKQEWRWPRYNKNRGTNMSKLLVHEHTIGNDHSALERRLEKIALDIDHEISLVQLLEKMRTAFDVEASEESSKAAKVMAKLYYELEAHLPQEGPEAARNLHKISVTMTRILFLVFADDTMMWDEENLFRNFIAFETEKDGSDLAAKLEQLFVVLNSDKKNRPQVSGCLTRFKYVNGGIFSEDIILPTLSGKMRELLLEACRFNWGNISPAIFGSMFQAVKSKELRRELGAHYTGEKDILKTLKPLFLDELHAEFERTKTLTNPTIPLNALRKRLGQIKILDPACGCGNFLIVAYRELRELELQIMEALQDHRGDSGVRTLDATLALQVSLTQIHGIEIDEWPARIAETALHLIDRQCNLRLIEKFGEAPERLPISEAAKIVTATDVNPDAGNALRIDWNSVVSASDDVVIVGNPPFSGQKERSAKQTEDMKLVWGKGYHGYLDFVTAWYAKALEYFGSHHGRWAFVSTNSVAQGQSVPYLFRPLFSAGWGIRFAHTSFAWMSEATNPAGVHCVIIGFDREPGGERLLFNYARPKGEPIRRTAKRINAYLLDAENLFVTKRMTPISSVLPPVQSGSKSTDWDFLTVTEDQLLEVKRDAVAAKYLRPYIGTQELLHDDKRWCLWLAESSAEDRRNSPEISRRMAEITARRLASPKGPTVSLANSSHLFGEIRQPTGPYLGLPQTFSENRKYFTAARLDASVVASIKLFTAPDEDGFLFGLVSSELFLAWQAAVGGRLESRYSFSNTVVWNNFPVPESLKDDQRKKVIDAGRCVLEARTQLQGTLAEKYEPSSMSPNLLNAHKALDLAVYELFGLRQPLQTEAQRQEFLFKRYVLMTSTTSSL